MKVLGLDVGSTYIKIALFEKENLKALERDNTSYTPLEKALYYIEKYQPDQVVATGYGRNLVHTNLENCTTISEIKAFAIGAKFIHPTVKTILDIGGQDTKVISLDETGKVVKFEMNDRCSAGTGRFLEIMCRALGYQIEELNHLEIEGEVKVKISSLCTVFAESEVISLIAQGLPREEILKGVHLSVVYKVISMLKRISVKEDLVFAGGCSQNKLLKRLLEDQLKTKIITLKESPFLGAIGAGVFGLLKTRD
ncbi:activase [Thermodesulfobacterium sp. TA1]|uniref:acyl-CoA dehydratase activase n=1 Tax=Thermodesulfobacterium sp. TA1 TaxID=2234087 RepID=UPI0012318620|nr:acyl-CoA dehydratase activase [Thermodesulfobacterium sp. TA1]QER42241.1 activase [Thermodesulfobacterium sp. TA1]